MLTVADLIFDLKFLQSGRMSPWFGPALRGGFGAVLRYLSCGLQRATCAECPVGSVCAYGYLFATPGPGYETRSSPDRAPHPFVFRPPRVDRTAAGETVSLGLTLVGGALSYIPYIVLGLSELGRRGLGSDRAAFEMVGVRCGRTGAVVGSERPRIEELSFTVDPVPLSDGPRPSRDRFVLELLTPVRLKASGRRLFHFDFRVFAVSAVRRLEFLGERHCGVDLFGRYRPYIEHASEVRTTADRTRFDDRSRYSRTQGRSMPLGGAVGELELEGDYDFFRPLLEAASLLSVGSHTAFGLGQARAGLLRADMAMPGASLGVPAAAGRTG